MYHSRMDGLTQLFDQKELFGFTRFVPHMNDLNQQELSRYTSPAQCTWAVDLSELYSREDALRPFESSQEWKRVYCAKFADAQATKQPFRSFALLWPVDAWFQVETQRYCLFSREA
jgi:hypothetical protein